ncbi:hypothetical protein [Nostoc sp.]|uniref:hypothetical protein n=1 Tax=Nostoc sp. TaxID=1180 RepID=UPI003FA5E605
MPSPAELEAVNCQLKLTLKDLENTQAQLIQTEKMSSLGQLVAGIAYEINNPVNFIDGNIIIVNEYIRDLLNLITLSQEYNYHLVSEIQAYIKEIDLDLIKEDLPKILSSMKMGAERISKLVLSLRPTNGQ